MSQRDLNIGACVFVRREVAARCEHLLWPLAHYPHNSSLPAHENKASRACIQIRGGGPLASYNLSPSQDTAESPLQMINFTIDLGKNCVWDILGRASQGETPTHLFVVTRRGKSRTDNNTNTNSPRFCMNAKSSSKNSLLFGLSSIS